MPGGRPTDYDPEVHPAKAEALAKIGLTNTQIAEELGIATSTFHLWRNEYKEFSDAVKMGKKTPDDNVEASLYKRATGYTFVETKETKNENGKITETVTTIKTVPPDTGAACMWLKNRRPEEWRDKIQQEITGKDGGPVQTSADISLILETLKDYPEARVKLAEALDKQ